MPAWTKAIRLVKLDLKWLRPSDQVLCVLFVDLLQTFVFRNCLLAHQVTRLRVVQLI
jgi:hypothetical protein